MNHNSRSAKPALLSILIATLALSAKAHNIHGVQSCSDLLNKEYPVAEGQTQNKCTEVLFYYVHETLFKINLDGQEKVMCVSGASDENISAFEASGLNFEYDKSKRIKDNYSIFVGSADKLKMVKNDDWKKMQPDFLNIIRNTSAKITQMRKHDITVGDQRLDVVFYDPVQKQIKLFGPLSFAKDQTNDRTKQFLINIINKFQFGDASAHQDQTMKDLAVKAQQLVKCLNDEKSEECAQVKDILHPEITQESVKAKKDLTDAEIDAMVKAAMDSYNKVFADKMNDFNKSVGDLLVKSSNNKRILVEDDNSAKKQGGVATTDNASQEINEEGDKLKDINQEANGKIVIDNVSIDNENQLTLEMKQIIAQVLKEVESQAYKQWGEAIAKAVSEYNGELTVEGSIPIEIVQKLTDDLFETIESEQMDAILQRITDNILQQAFQTTGQDKPDNANTTQARSSTDRDANKKDVSKTDSVTSQKGAKVLLPVVGESSIGKDNTTTLNKDSSSNAAERDTSAIGSDKKLKKELSPKKNRLTPILICIIAALALIAVIGAVIYSKRVSGDRDVDIELATRA